MAVVGVSLLWFGATDATAQPTGVPDHLKCYQVLKDTHQGPVKKHIVDLFNQQFGAEPGCTLSDKAKYFCAPTQKVNVDGHPPLSPFPTQPVPSDYICYQVRCPHPVTQQFHPIDQFAIREMTIKNAQLLCAPAEKL